MQSNHKLYAKFRQREDDFTTITILPVLFFAETDTLEYVAIVPYPANDTNVNMHSRALPVDCPVIRGAVGDFNCFIDEAGLFDAIQKSLAWVDKDSDNRDFQLYPNFGNARLERFANPSTPVARSATM